MSKLFAAAAVMAMGVTAVFGAADVLDGKSAKKMLFSHTGSEFVTKSQAFLTNKDMATLTNLAGMREFRSVLYYGAGAASPKDEIVSKATVTTSMYHSPEAAELAAINECNGLRTGGEKCLVVAHILPKKYIAHPFQLSASATAVFKKNYLRGNGPKALAISPTLGVMAFPKGMWRRMQQLRLVRRMALRTVRSLFRIEFSQQRHFVAYSQAF